MIKVSAINTVTVYSLKPLIASTVNGIHQRENVAKQKVIFTFFTQLKMINVNKNYLENQCKWTECTLEGRGPFACSLQFGDEWRQTPKQQKCRTIYYKYECCNH